MLYVLYSCVPSLFRLAQYQQYYLGTYIMGATFPPVDYKFQDIRHDGPPERQQSRSWPPAVR